MSSNTENKITEELNERQKKFCENYVVDWNGTRSYMDAYPDADYDSAKTNASRLLTNANIKSYIEECKNKTAELAGISALRIANEYKKIAFNSAAALRKGWDDVKDWDELTEEEKAIISEVETITTHRVTDDGSMLIEKKLKYKTYDKQKALAELKKMFGYDSPEKVEHSGGIKTTYSDLTEEEIQERLERIRNRP